MHFLKIWLYTLLLKGMKTSQQQSKGLFNEHFALSFLNILHEPDTYQTENDCCLQTVIHLEGTATLDPKQHLSYHVYSHLKLIA